MNTKPGSVLITGSKRGIGNAIWKRFMYDGWVTFGVTRPWGDVREKEITEVLPKIMEADAVICAAGVYGPIGPLETNHLSEWYDCIETNVLGVVNVCHAFIPQMKKRRYGKIIILSGGGATRPRPNFSAYATSKAAVVRFMETIAEELKPYNIDVNCMAPGAIGTSIHDKTIAAGPELAGKAEYENALRFKSENTDYTKACDLAVWLASPFSNGITGKLISVHDDYLKISP